MPSFFCAVASQSPHAYNIFPQVALLFFVIFATVVKFTSVKREDLVPVMKRQRKNLEPQLLKLKVEILKTRCFIGIRLYLFV